MATDSIIRVSKKESPFAQIDRGLINDKRLNWDTRGMLIWLLDKPDGWGISIGSLCSQSPVGRTAVSRMIKEAESFGYIERKAFKKADGRFSCSYTVYEQPNQKPTSPDQVFRRGSPDAVHPTRFTRRGSPDAENLLHSNTVYSNTDIEILNYQYSERDTHHHHPQTPSPPIPNDDDDDDDLNLGSTNQLSPHFEIAKAIIEKMPEWTGGAAFLSTLNERQLIAAASWLYLWFVGQYPEEVSKYRRWAFDGVDNVVGKIITQARQGNVAPLNEEHKQALMDELKEISSST